MRRLVGPAFLPVVALGLVSLGCNFLTPSQPATTQPSEASDPSEDDHGDASAAAWVDTADLDGDGKTEQIIVDGGKVRVGKATAEFPQYDFSGDREVEVIDIDKNTPGKELAVIDTGIEDDATYYIFVYRNGALTRSDIGTGNQPSIKGDGFLVTRNSSCGVTVEQKFGLDGTKVVKKSETTSGQHDDAECAACPYVYVRGSKGLRFAGEILRHLRGPELRSSQSLALEPGDLVDGKVRVRLAERKPETTYLDSIHLSVGGVRVRPESCKGEHAWCENDRVYAEIPFGDHLDFVFHVPPDAVASGAPIELWAEGYYVPLQP